MEKIVLCIVLCGILSSCEDVVDVMLQDSAPRLVIEASINLLEDGTSNSTVMLSTTAPFFNDQRPFVDNAFVKITDSDGAVYRFDYVENGEYKSSLIPAFNRDYILEVVYEGETYTATEQLESVPPLEFVQQRNDGGFTGNEIELKAYFTDPGGVDNFYFFEGLAAAGNSYDTFYDEFFDGNPIFGFFLIEGLEPGDTVVFNLYGVDVQYYNFMFTLLQQTGQASDGPFETQPATVRGNIVNLDNQENFPLGYFRVSEVSTLIYEVQ